MIYRSGIRSLFLPAVLLIVVSSTVYSADLVHIVAKGETVYSISRSYKISQEELMRRNNLADALKLQVGMRLVIPGLNSTASSGTTLINTSGQTTASVSASAYSEYIVAQNDTLYSIARTRGVTLQSLNDINGFSKNYVLKAGEKIKIPKAAATGSVVTIRNEPPQASQRKADPSLRWPLASKEVVYMKNNMGVLVAGQKSESIKSLTSGTVVYASPWRGYGNVVVVEADKGYRYLYGACDTISVRKGDSIEPGTELGKLGTYPASGKSELVLIISQNGSPVDPAKAPRI